MIEQADVVLLAAIYIYIGIGYGAFILRQNEWQIEKPFVWVVTISAVIVWPLALSMIFWIALSRVSGGE